VSPYNITKPVTLIYNAIYLQKYFQYSGSFHSVSRISELVVLSIKSVLAKGTDFHEVTDKFAAVVTGEVQKRKFLTVCLFIYSSIHIKKEKHNFTREAQFGRSFVFCKYSNICDIM